MTIFELQHVPLNVPKQRLEKSIERLTQFHVFLKQKHITLSYLGGITNHGLREHQHNFFVRIPGINSNHFVDRAQELDTLHQLADAGLYPRVIEAYATGELKGYKVEPFIEGETLQFSDFAQHQFNVLPELRALHDAPIELARTYDIFQQLHAMCDALLTQGQMELPFLFQNTLKHMPLDEVKHHIYALHTIKHTLFTGPVALAPCHNDITPTNFIRLKHPSRDKAYQLIDWEYAGMNDPMYDVAGITAMLGLSLDAADNFVLRYFNSLDAQRYAEEIKRVKFYMPLVKLYYAIWAALQVSTGNESTSIDELKYGWGPGSLSVFLNQYHSTHYQEIIQSHTS